MNCWQIAHKNRVESLAPRRVHPYRQIQAVEQARHCLGREDNMECPSTERSEQFRGRGVGCSRPFANQYVGVKAFKGDEDADVPAVKYFSPQTSVGIIRVSREHHKVAWAALTMLTSIDGVRYLPNLVHLSGEPHGSFLVEVIC